MRRRTINRLDTPKYLGDDLGILLGNGYTRSPLIRPDRESTPSGWTWEPLGTGGRSLTYKRRDNFVQYVKSPWVRSATPDVVLIDGRCRVCCFFTSLLQATPGTIVVFDDYINRPHYHIVEELLVPFEWCGRQAIFSVPPDLDRQRALALADRFLYVTD
jgi:hypothetical protein